jgi:hypothetical protein
MYFFQYHFHVSFLIGLTGVHLMLLVSDSVSDTWQDQLLMVEKNVQISSNLAEVIIIFCYLLQNFCNTLWIYSTIYLKEYIIKVYHDFIKMFALH